MEAARRVYVALGTYEHAAAFCGIKLKTLWNALNPEKAKASFLRRDKKLKERVRVRVFNANAAEKKVFEKDTGKYRQSITEAASFKLCKTFKARLRKRIDRSIQGANRTAIKHNEPNMLKTDEVLEKVLANPVCHYSGRPIDLEGDIWQMDHIEPLARGGKNKLNNFVICLQAYNSMKGELTIEEWTLASVRFLEHFNGLAVTGHEHRDLEKEARDSARRLFEAKAKRDCLYLTKKYRAEKTEQAKKASTPLTSDVSSAYVPSL